MEAIRNLKIYEQEEQIERRAEDGCVRMEKKGGDYKKEQGSRRYAYPI